MDYYLISRQTVIEMGHTDKMPSDISELFHQLRDEEKFTELWDEWHAGAADNEQYERNYFLSQAGHHAMGNGMFRQEQMLTPPEHMEYYNNATREKLTASIDEQKNKHTEREEVFVEEERQTAAKEKQVAQPENNREALGIAWMDNYFFKQEQKEASNDNVEKESAVEQFASNQKDVDKEQERE